LSSARPTAAGIGRGIVLKAVQPERADDQKKKPRKKEREKSNEKRESLSGRENDRME